MKISLEMPISSLATFLVLAACSPPEEDLPRENEAPDNQSAEISSAAPQDDTSAPASLPNHTEQAGTTMPEAIRGTWREDDLGRNPTAEDCNQTSSTNRNFGKVLTVRADGYSLFEAGGKIIEVHNRTDTMIDATFDTSRAGPSKARKDFALQPGDSLAVNDDDGDGQLSVTQYLPCPKG